MDERGTIDGGRQAGGPDVAPEDEDVPERERGEPHDDRRVGLGRVVEDRLSTGSPDAGDPGGPDAPAGMRAAPDEASEDSFPASDPPGFTGTKAADGER